MAELTLTGVRRDFGKASVIKGIDLEVRDGEFVVLVGPSGCGKSTLLRLIAGLDRVSGGAIAIDGRDVSGLLPAERGIAMVFQSYALYPHMTVAKNLSFGLENLRLAKPEIDRRVSEAARMLAIESLLARKPKELSGGQRQRVAIGRAIVRDPKLFLFDEPLSNLDAALRVQTRAEITGLHKRLGATMIYVTHDQVEAMTMADRIAVLNAGRLEQFGAPLELFDRPINRFVAGFIGSPRMNFYAGRLRRDGSAAIADVPGFGDVSAPWAAASLSDGAPVELGIRPNHFKLAAQDHAVRASFQAERAESVGTETYVYGRIAGNEAATVLHLPGHVPVREGDTLDVSVDPSLCHLFDQATGHALRDALTEAPRAA